MVELDLEPEAPRGLLLEALVEVDRVPEPSGHVADAVAGNRGLERSERARIGPPLDEAGAVPRVHGRIDRPRVPPEERDEVREQEPVEAAERGQDFAPPEFPRRPE